jgi:glutamate racemase
MGDQRPIGIFDSGVGGLTVLKEIRERLPLEPTIYVADLLHFPYGPRYQDEVRGFAIDIIRYLESRDVKLVVIACNTATAAALNQARELFELPIIGVISPGAQAAVEATKNNRIGVISTEGTMRSQEYLHAIKEIDPMVGVYQKACPELVEIVENGESDSPRAERVLLDNLADIVRLGADTLRAYRFSHDNRIESGASPGAFAAPSHGWQPAPRGPGHGRPAAVRPDRGQPLR